MKNRTILLITICMGLFMCTEKPDMDKLRGFAPTERFPADTWLETAPVKKALVVVAHDDDNCAMSGTLAKLAKAGWEIEQWNLENTELAKGRDTHPNTELGIRNHLLPIGGQYRNIKDSSLARYHVLPLDQIDALFETEKVREVLRKKINAFQPSVIFTLDDVIGGYGHPDHIFISRLVLDMYRKGEINPHYIYQSVFTDHMEREIVEVWLTARLKSWGYDNMYLMAKELYNVEGMPEPTIEINIYAEAVTKMRYLRSYHEKAQKNLRKFIPYYDVVEPEVYFGIFDREFFRVIKL